MGSRPRDRPLSPVEGEGKEVANSDRPHRFVANSGTDQVRGVTTEVVRIGRRFEDQFAVGAVNLRIVTAVVVQNDRDLPVAIVVLLDAESQVGPLFATRVSNQSS